jgi:hypothetical protein
MTPEERKMLEESLTLARENNDIMKRMWRSTRVGRAIKIIYWVVIIGASVGAVYFFQPYLDAVKGFSGSTSSPEQFSDIKSLFGF